MFSRSPSYEWDWEEFMIQYMVLDACWKMGERLCGLKCMGHKDRATRLMEHFSIRPEDYSFDLAEMVRLRNDLFHEALWFRQRPGATIGNLGYHMPTKMCMLNEQFIGAFLQFP